MGEVVETWLSDLDRVCKVAELEAQKKLRDDDDYACSEILNLVQDLLSELRWLKEMRN